MPDVRMPDGTLIRNVPQGATREQIQQAYQRAKAAEKRPEGFWQGVLEGASKVVGNAGEYIENTPVIGTPMKIAGAVSSFLQGAPRKQISDQYRDRQRKQFAGAKYKPSNAGKLTGEVLASLPLGMAPGGAFLQGVAGGALVTDDPKNRNKMLADAALGGVGGKLGQQVGKRVIAPIAERVGRTAPVRKAAVATANAVNKVLPNAVRLPPTAPRLKSDEKTITRYAPQLDQVRTNVEDAARLNLPYALADASPKLRTLAGSVSRKSTDANALAERTFAPRARGQADRAIDAIDSRLAPITDIEARSAEIMDAGKPVYGPLYEKAYAGPTVTSPNIERILSSPAGRQAVTRANTIAANEFRDPTALGFALDEAGNVVLNTPPVPQMDRLDGARQAWDAANAAYENAVRRQQASLSPHEFAPQVSQAEQALAAANAELDAAKAGFNIAPRSGTVQDATGYTPQSLDYVKGGFDDMLEPYRNEITNRLVLDRNGRAINSMKNDLLGELDNLNPDYKAARSAYGDYAGQEQALREGYKVLPNSKLPERNFDRFLERGQQYDAALEPGQEALARVPEMQKGYATALADQVDAMRFSGNPYEAVYGSPLQQKKIAALFPEGGADFDRIYNLEADMSKTAWETLGGSPTQRRAIADQLFDSKVANYGASAMEAVSNPKWAMGKAALQKLQDTARVKGEQRANELAPVLFDTSNPTNILAYLDDLARKQEEMRARQATYGQIGGLLGLPVGAGTVGLLGTP